MTALAAQGPVPGAKPRGGRDIITEFHFRRGAWPIAKKPVRQDSDSESTVSEASEATAAVQKGTAKFSDHVLRT